MTHPQSGCFLAVSYITTGRPLSTLMISDVSLHTTHLSCRGWTWRARRSGKGSD